MPVNPEKLDKFKKAWSLINDDTVSKKDFIDLSTTLISFIKEARTKLDKDTTASGDKISREVSASLKSFQKEVQKLRAEIKESADFSDKRAKSVLAETKQLANSMRDMVFNIGDEMVRARIDMDRMFGGLPEAETPTAIRTKLESLKGDERLDKSAIRGLEEAIKETGGTTRRLGWGAHPLTVMATGVAIDKNVRFIDFRGAGVTSVVRSSTGVLTVTVGGGGGGGSTVETPTGTVNASNAVFTPSAEPQYVVADGITSFAGAGYTWNGTTITMDIPPSQYIRAII